MKLFDSLIKPVILYGCEIWGPELLSYKTDFDKSTIEQVHIRFCKQILHLPSYTSNLKSRAELGRFPLSIDIKKHIATYFLRLKTNIENPILKDAFKYAMSKPTNIAKVIKNFSELRNFQKREEILAKHEIKLISNKIQEQLRNDFKRNFFEKITNGNSDSDRLSYTDLKTIYEPEEYLEKVHNIAYRILITKYRTGVHKLRINTGHYENNGHPIPFAERKCKNCNTNHVENERHFLLACTKFKDTRSTFMQILFQNQQIPETTEQNQTRLIELLNGKTKDANWHIIGKFLYVISKERDAM